MATRKKKKNKRKQPYPYSWEPSGAPKGAKKALKARTFEPSGPRQSALVSRPKYTQTAHYWASRSDEDLDNDPRGAQREMRREAQEKMKKKRAVAEEKTFWAEHAKLLSEDRKDRKAATAAAAAKKKGPKTETKPAVLLVVGTPKMGRPSKERKERKEHTASGLPAFLKNKTSRAALEQKLYKKGLISADGTPIHGADENKKLGKYERAYLASYPKLKRRTNKKQLKRSAEK